jgi:mannose-6-phosphate isomerase-like protein (cupin superfamily)
MKYLIQRAPVRIPVPDNKLIEEHFGLASQGGASFSLAHMEAPAGWSEPFQQPDFDEITIMIKGRKRIEIDGDTVELSAGESILIRKGARVRYSNPYNEPNEYWSVCVPAFSPDSVNRDPH